MIVSMIAALALQASGSAPADSAKSDPKTDKPAATDVAKPADDPSQKKICRTDNAAGSHIPTKICKTKAQWDKIAEDAKSTADRIGDFRSAGGAPGI